MQITLNGETTDLSDPATVADLIDSMGLAGRRVAVEHNGSLVPRDTFDSTQLTDGDRLEVVQAIGGGAPYHDTRSS